MHGLYFTIPSCMQRKLLLASTLYYWSCPWLISGERRHFETRAAHLQFQRAGTVTLMWVDFKVWCPKAQRSLPTRTQPHLSHYSLDLEGMVPGSRGTRRTGSKASKPTRTWVHGLKAPIERSGPHPGQKAELSSCTMRAPGRALSPGSYDPTPEHQKSQSSHWQRCRPGPAKEEKHLVLGIF